MIMATAMSAAVAGVPEAPHLLVDRVIAYEMSGNADMRSRTFGPFLTPRLRAAIQQDMQGEEVAVLDYDPICQCQDYDGLKMRLRSLGKAGSHVIAIVQISGSERQQVNLHLAPTSYGWRINDISTATRPSLLRLLSSAKRNDR